MPLLCFGGFSVEPGENCCRNPTSGRWEGRTPGLRGEREKVKLGVATPRDLLECGWRGWGASWERAGSQSRAEKEVEEEGRLEEYRNGVVEPRFSSTVPRAPSEVPRGRRPPLRRVPFPAPSARPPRLAAPVLAAWSGRSHGASAAVSTNGAGGLVPLGAPPCPPAPRSRGHPRWVWCGEGTEQRRDPAAPHPRRSPWACGAEGPRSSQT